MRTSNRTGFWAGVLLCIFAAGVCEGDSLPTAEDVEALAARMELCLGKVRDEEADELRLVFEYKKELLDPNEKGRLASLLKEVGDGLAEVKGSQAELKKRIENYEGADWDARYGQTGLWERIEADLFRTTLHKWILDSYLAPMVEERERILQGALSEIDAAIQIYDVAAARMIRAKILAALCDNDEVARNEALKEAEGIISRDDAATVVKLEMEIVKARLVGDAAGLEQLGERIASEEDENVELLTALFSAAGKLQDPDLLDSLMHLYEAIGEYLGRFVIGYVERCIEDGTEAQILAPEADIAAIAVRRQAGRHRTALEYLTEREDCQSAAVLYVAGAAVAEAEPDRAVELLVTASRLQKENGDARLHNTGKGIAEQAAQVAYQGWSQKNVDAKGAIEAFDNYARFAGDAMEEELRGRYVELLEVGAEDVNDLELYGQWEYRARLVRGAASERELVEIIEECRKREYGEVRGDAAAAYCGLLLERDSEGAAEKVLEVWAGNEDVATGGMKAYKAAALARLGRVNEAAGCMAEVKDWRYAAQAVEVLDKVAERVEELMERQDWAQLAADCNSIAEFCGKCIAEESRPAVVAEIVLVCDANEKRGLARAERLLAEMPDGETIDYIRCRARILAVEGEFLEAAGLWAKIGTTLKAQVTSDGSRSWQWWRAKYYELACLAKSPNADKAAIAHSIEVLENSFSGIPGLWSRKLKELKIIG